MAVDTAVCQQKVVQGNEADDGIDRISRHFTGNLIQYGYLPTRFEGSRTTMQQFKILGAVVMMDEIKEQNSIVTIVPIFLPQIARLEANSLCQIVPGDILFRRFQGHRRVQNGGLQPRVLLAELDAEQAVPTTHIEQFVCGFG